MTKLRRQIKVRDLEPDWHAFVHNSDTQDVEFIEEYLPPKRRGEYDSYFALELDGEFVLIYGMHGIIANMDKTLTKVFGSVSTANLLRSIGKI